jgi:hypothetical protein
MNTPAEQLEEIYTGLPPSILDVEDERDYLMSELGGSDDNLYIPTESSQIFIDILNQGRGNKCSIYASVGLMNNQNFKEAGMIGAEAKFDSPESYVTDATKRGFNPKFGWYVRSSCQMLVDLKKIEGFVKCITKADIMRGIHYHSGVVMSSSKIDWRQSGLQKKLVRGNVGGHIFYTNRYNQDGFWIYNSFGRAWGDNGSLFVSWNDLDVLNPSIMAFMDKSDEVELYSLKALKKGITNQTFEQFRANDYATRQEAALFVSRAFTVEQSLLWNTTRPNDQVSSYELDVMIARAKKLPERARKPDEKKLKRWEVVKVIYT